MKLATVLRQLSPILKSYSRCYFLLLTGKDGLMDCKLQFCDLLAETPLGAVLNIDWVLQSKNVSTFPYIIIIIYIRSHVIYYI